jgi:hypothetical protein
VPCHVLESSRQENVTCGQSYRYADAYVQTGLPIAPIVRVGNVVANDRGLVEALNANGGRHRV